MRATEEREDTETVSREIKHSEHKSVPAIQAALGETLCPRGEKLAVWDRLL